MGKNENRYINLKEENLMICIHFCYFSTYGFIDLKYLLKKVVSQNYQLEDTVEHAVFQKFYRVKEESILGLVSRLLETEGFVAVVDGSDHVIGVIDHLQLLNFISKSGNSNSQ